MNRYESIVACLVIVFFAVVLLVKFIFEALKLLLGNIVDFLSLAPPWFWGTAIAAAVIICLIGFALWVLHKNTRMRREAAVMPVNAENAVIFHDGGFTAVSFGGRQISSKQIGHNRPLTQAEQRILTGRLSQNLLKGKVEYTVPGILKGKGGV
jgi:hypothetical protein